MSVQKFPKFLALASFVSICLSAAAPANAGQIFQRNNGGWGSPVAGCAQDVGVGAEGSVWVIGCDSVAGGRSIHKWEGGNNWRKVLGGAVKIAVQSNGNPVVVSDSGQIYSGDQYGNWTPMAGCAKDIGSANGAIYVVGCDRVDGGYRPYRWTGSSWQPMPGGVVAISVRPNGNPVAVNERNEIFSWDGSTWQVLPGNGRANDIAAGGDGSVWVIGNDPQLGGYGIYKHTASGWQIQGGAATRIAVNPQGVPWVVNNIGDTGTSNNSGDVAMLPFQNGKSTTITQGNFAQGAAYSHSVNWPVAPGFNVYAVDFGLAEGSEVRSVRKGTVVYAGWKEGGWGNIVIVKYSDNKFGHYEHLKSINVTANQQISGGALIGLSGNTGNSYGPHLHYHEATGAFQASVQLPSFYEGNNLVNVGATVTSQNSDGRQ
jgi:Peptidase family M23/Tectonin domain